MEELIDEYIKDPTREKAVDLSKNIYSLYKMDLFLKLDINLIYLVLEQCEDLSTDFISLIINKLAKYHEINGKEFFKHIPNFEVENLPFDYKGNVISEGADNTKIVYMEKMLQNLLTTVDILSQKISDTQVVLQKHCNDISSDSRTGSPSKEYDVVLDKLVSDFQTQQKIIRDLENLVNNQVLNKKVIPPDTDSDMNRSTPSESPRQDPENRVKMLVSFLENAARSASADESTKNGKEFENDSEIHSKPELHRIDDDNHPLSFQTNNGFNHDENKRKKAQIDARNISLLKELSEELTDKLNNSFQSLSNVMASEPDPEQIEIFSLAEIIEKVESMKSGVNLIIRNEAIRKEAEEILGEFGNGIDYVINSEIDNQRKNIFVYSLSEREYISLEKNCFYIFYNDSKRHNDSSFQFSPDCGGGGPISNGNKIFLENENNINNDIYLDTGCLDTINKNIESHVIIHCDRPDGGEKVSPEESFSDEVLDPESFVLSQNNLFIENTEEFDFTSDDFKSERNDVKAFCNEDSRNLESSVSIHLFDALKKSVKHLSSRQYSTATDNPYTTAKAIDYTSDEIDQRQGLAYIGSSNLLQLANDSAMIIPRKSKDLGMSPIKKPLILSRKSPSNFCVLHGLYSNVDSAKYCSKEKRNLIDVGNQNSKEFVNTKESNLTLNPPQEIFKNDSISNYLPKEFNRRENMLSFYSAGEIYINNELLHHEFSLDRSPLTDKHDDLNQNCDSLHIFDHVDSKQQCAYADGYHSSLQSNDFHLSDHEDSQNLPSGSALSLRALEDSYHSTSRIGLDKSISDKSNELSSSLHFRDLNSQNNLHEYSDNPGKLKYQDIMIQVESDGIPPLKDFLSNDMHVNTSIQAHDNDLGRTTPNDKNPSGSVPSYQDCNYQQEIELHSLSKGQDSSNMNCLVSRNSAIMQASRTEISISSAKSRSTSVDSNSSIRNDSLLKADDELPSNFFYVNNNDVEEGEIRNNDTAGGCNKGCSSPGSMHTVNNDNSLCTSEHYRSTSKDVSDNVSDILKCSRATKSFDSYGDAYYGTDKPQDLGSIEERVVQDSKVSQNLESRSLPDNNHNSRLNQSMNKIDAPSPSSKSTDCHFDGYIDSKLAVDQVIENYKSPVKKVDSKILNTNANDSSVTAPKQHLAESRNNGNFNENREYYYSGQKCDMNLTIDGKYVDVDAHKIGLSHMLLSNDRSDGQANNIQSDKDLNPTYTQQSGDGNLNVSNDFVHSSNMVRSRGSDYTLNNMEMPDSVINECSNIELSKQEFTESLNELAEYDPRNEQGELSSLNDNKHSYNIGTRRGYYDNSSDAGDLSSKTILFGRIPTKDFVPYYDQNTSDSNISFDLSINDGELDSLGDNSTDNFNEEDPQLNSRTVSHDMSGSETIHFKSQTCDSICNNLYYPPISDPSVECLASNISQSTIPSSIEPETLIDDPILDNAFSVELEHGESVNDSKNAGSYVQECPTNVEISTVKSCHYKSLDAIEYCNRLNSASVPSHPANYHEYVSLDKCLTNDEVKTKLDNISRSSISHVHEDSQICGNDTSNFPHDVGLVTSGTETQKVSRDENLSVGDISDTVHCKNMFTHINSESEMNNNSYTNEKEVLISSVKSHPSGNCDDCNSPSQTEVNMSSELYEAPNSHGINYVNNDSCMDSPQNKSRLYDVLHSTKLCNSSREKNADDAEGGDPHTINDLGFISDDINDFCSGVVESDQYFAHSSNMTLSRIGFSDSEVFARENRVYDVSLETSDALNDAFLDDSASFVDKRSSMVDGNFAKSTGFTSETSFANIRGFEQDGRVSNLSTCTASYLHNNPGFISDNDSHVPINFVTRMSSTYRFASEENVYTSLFDSSFQEKNALGTPSLESIIPTSNSNINIGAPSNYVFLSEHNVSRSPDYSRIQKKKNLTLSITRNVDLSYDSIDETQKLDTTTDFSGRLDSTLFDNSHLVSKRTDETAFDDPSHYVPLQHNENSLLNNLGFIGEDNMYLSQINSITESVSDNEIFRSGYDGKTPSSVLKVDSSITGEKSISEQDSIVSEGKSRSKQNSIISEGKSRSGQNSIVSEGKSRSEQNSIISEGKNRSGQNSIISEGKNRSGHNSIVSEGKSRSEQNSIVSEGKSRSEQNSIISEEKNRSGQNSIISEGKSRSKQNSITSEGKNRSGHNSIVSEGKSRSEQNSIISEGKNRSEHNSIISEGKNRSGHNSIVSEGKSRSEQNSIISEGKNRSGQNNIISEGKSRSEQNSIISEGKSRSEQNSIISEGKSRSGHNSVVSEGKSRSEHNSIISEGKSRSEHNSIISEGKNRSEQNSVLSEGMGKCDTEFKSISVSAENINVIKDAIAAENDDIGSSNVILKGDNNNMECIIGVDERSNREFSDVVLGEGMCENGKIISVSTDEIGTNNITSIISNLPDGNDAYSHSNSGDHLGSKKLDVSFTSSHDEVMLQKNLSNANEQPYAQICNHLALDDEIEEFSIPQFHDNTFKRHISHMAICDSTIDNRFDTSSKDNVDAKDIISDEELLNDEINASLSQVSMENKEDNIVEGVHEFLPSGYQNEASIYSKTNNNPSLIDYESDVCSHPNSSACDSLSSPSLPPVPETDYVEMNARNSYPSHSSLKLTSNECFVLDLHTEDGVGESQSAFKSILKRPQQNQSPNNSTHGTVVSASQGTQEETINVQQDADAKFEGRSNLDLQSRSEYDVRYSGGTVNNVNEGCPSSVNFLVSGKMHSKTPQKTKFSSNNNFKAQMLNIESAKSLYNSDDKLNNSDSPDQKVCIKTEDIYSSCEKSLDRLYESVFNSPRNRKAKDLSSNSSVCSGSPLKKGSTAENYQHDPIYSRSPLKQLKPNLIITSPRKSYNISIDKNLSLEIIARRRLSPDPRRRLAHHSRSERVNLVIAPAESYSRSRCDPTPSDASTVMQSYYSTSSSLLNLDNSLSNVASEVIPRSSEVRSRSLDNTSMQLDGNSYDNSYFSSSFVSTVQSNECKPSQEKSNVDDASPVEIKTASSKRKKIKLADFVKSNDLESLTYILERRPEKVNKKDSHNFGRTLIHVAVDLGRYKIVEYLISKGANMNIVDYDGYSPLQLAYFRGKINMFKLLVNSGANVDARNYEGMTVLDIACEKGDMDIAEFVVSKGASLNERNNRGLMPLHVGVQNGNYALCNLLVQNGADVNGRDGNKRTPLHIASIKGHNQICILLLNNGAQINVTDPQGRTPLHYASYGNNRYICELLIKKGGSVNIRDIYDRTALCMAESRGYGDLCNYLSSEGGIC